MGKPRPTENRPATTGPLNNPILARLCDDRTALECLREWIDGHNSVGETNPNRSGICFFDAPNHATLEVADQIGDVIAQVFAQEGIPVKYLRKQDGTDTGEMLKFEIISDADTERKDEVRAIMHKVLNAAEAMAETRDRKRGTV